MRNFVDRSRCGFLSIHFAQKHYIRIKKRMGSLYCAWKICATWIGRSERGRNQCESNSKEVQYSAVANLALKKEAEGIWERKRSHKCPKEEYILLKNITLGFIFGVLCLELKGITKSNAPISSLQKINDGLSMKVLSIGESPIWHRTNSLIKRLLTVSSNMLTIKFWRNKHILRHDRFTNVG